MIASIKTSVKVFGILAAAYIFCVVIITIFSQILFYNKAHGELISSGDKYVGSKLLGQSFTQTHYFHSRPSMTLSSLTGVAVSASSNLRIGSKEAEDKLTELYIQQSKQMKDVNAEMVTYSASGLDPHISFESALAQVQRVANARKLNEDRVVTLVERIAQHSIYSSEQLVNVLELNLALDNLFGKVK